MQNLKKSNKCETLNCDGNGNVNGVSTSHRKTKNCPNRNLIEQNHASKDSRTKKSNAIINLFKNFLQNLKDENINFDFSKFKF